MAGGIFVSYRRDDSRHAAGRLLDRLRQTYEPHQLFMDVDNVAPGLDFVEVLSEQVAACDVMLVIIGPTWLDARDEKGNRRLDNPSDFVRVEVEAALRRDVRVIPVLVDGAAIPHKDALPTYLRPLARRQSVRLTHERFGSEADALVQSLCNVVQPADKKKLVYGRASGAQSGNVAIRAILRGMAVGLAGIVPGVALSFAPEALMEALLGGSGPVAVRGWPTVVFLMSLALAWWFLASGSASRAASSTLWEVACAAFCAAACFLVIRTLYLGGFGIRLTLTPLDGIGLALGAYALSLWFYLWEVWKVVAGDLMRIQR